MFYINKSLITKLMKLEELSKLRNKNHNKFLIMVFYINNIFHKKCCIFLYIVNYSINLY